MTSIDFTDPDTAREFQSRIKELVTYARLPVIRFEWTRQAYTDLTSMGGEYTEPEKQMIGYRAMDPAELAVATQEVVVAFPSVEGKVFDKLYPRALENRLFTYCTRPRRSSHDPRCLRCKGCLNYISVIDEIRGKPVVVPEKIEV